MPMPCNASVYGNGRPLWPSNAPTTESGGDHSRGLPRRLSHGDEEHLRRSIQTQLDVLNADFRRLNNDADDTWPQAADTQIEFCLASFDPQGNPTTGILRVPTTVNGFGTNDAVKFSARRFGRLALHRLPQLPGLQHRRRHPGIRPIPWWFAATDGVVNGCQYTGTIGTATAPFDKGHGHPRGGTLAQPPPHLGRWPAVRRLRVDTPTSTPQLRLCPRRQLQHHDMVQNYMDYSDDGCMNLFTQGQTDRMLALFQPGGFRESLLTSNACTPREVSCGCTDDTACNFDSNAANDDGSCDFSCYGCTDATACNYNPHRRLTTVLHEESQSSP